MSSTKKNVLDVKQVGTLKVPFSQGKFSQLLSWIQQGMTRGEECPVDTGFLPDQPPGPSSMKNGDVFYVFQRMEIENEEPILFYDRMKVMSGGLEEDGMPDFEIPHNHPLEGLGEDGLLREVAQAVYKEYKIVFSMDLLRKLRRSSKNLQDSSEVQDFVYHLKNRGLFKKASTPSSNRDPSVPIAENSD